MRDILRAVDKNTGMATETLARKLSRRRALANGVKGVVAATTALMLGQGLHHDAGAACVCNWAILPRCSGCPSGYGCPSGMTPCKLWDAPYDPNTGYGCNGYCNYSSGSWISCTGLGYGYGYMVCTDCKGPSCSNLCTCLSQCINCGVQAPVQ